MVKVNSGVQAGEVQIRRSEKKEIPSRVVKKGFTKEGQEGGGRWKRRRGKAKEPKQVLRMGMLRKAD